MMDIAGGVSVPVVFSDGERETNIGNVVVHPSLEFKTFQSIMSCKIGISPQQFSAFLAGPETQRKIPITAKFNFAAVSPAEDCFFLVVLKRSKRERRRRTRREAREDEYYGSRMSVVQRTIKKVPENVMLLRRNAGIESVQVQAFSGFVSVMDRVGYDNRVQELRAERDRYLMNMGLSGLNLGRGGKGDVAERGVTQNVVVECEECLRLRAMDSGREIGFHWCVYDAVTFGFRSPAGPIARPVKGSE
jgi:hypothetical protein